MAQRKLKAIGNRLLKPFYLSRDDHNRKIRTRKQRTDAGKYSFVNRTIRSWNQLPAGLLASFPCKINTFRKGVKNVVTSKSGLSVNKWSDVKCSDVERTDVIYVKWFCFEVKWSYVEVLGDKSTRHIRLTLYWEYLIVLWLFYLVYILYCSCFNLFCNMWVCVCVGFVMCGCVYVWVL